MALLRLAAVPDRADRDAWRADVRELAAGPCRVCRKMARNHIYEYPQWEGLREEREYRVVSGRMGAQSAECVLYEFLYILIALSHATV